MFRHSEMKLMYYRLKQRSNDSAARLASVLLLWQAKSG